MCLSWFPLSISFSFLHFTFTSVFAHDPPYCVEPNLMTFRLVTLFNTSKLSHTRNIFLIRLSSVLFQDLRSLLLFLLHVFHVYLPHHTSHSLNHIIFHIRNRDSLRSYYFPFLPLLTSCQPFFRLFLPLPAGCYPKVRYIVCTYK